jgi:hypothetical protein
MLIRRHHSHDVHDYTCFWNRIITNLKVCSVAIPLCTSLGPSDPTTGSSVDAGNPIIIIHTSFSTVYLARRCLDCSWIWLVGLLLNAGDRHGVDVLFRL